MQYREATEILWVFSDTQCHNVAGDSTVAVESGGTKLMQELKLGDRVRVVKPDGLLAWDEVYFFGHREEKIVGEFVRLTLEAGYVHSPKQSLMSINLVRPQCGSELRWCVNDSRVTLSALLPMEL